MKLYRIAEGYLVEESSRYFLGENLPWDQLIARENLGEHLKETIPNLCPIKEQSFAEIESRILPPIQSRKSGLRE